MYSGGVDPMPAFVVLAVTGFVIAFLATSRRRDVRLGWLVAAVYAALVVSVVFFPLPVTHEAVEYGRWRAERGLGPTNNVEMFATFRQTWGTSDFLRQVGGNAVLLLPLGVVVGVMVPGWTARTKVLVIVVVVVAIEGLQALFTAAYGFRFRSFDVDDLWLNLLGGLVGLATATVAARVWPLEPWLRRHRLVLRTARSDSVAPTS
jgi:glycopeptide antibiotics resistance protein